MRTKNVFIILFVLGMTFLPFTSPPVSAQEPGKWDHLDLTNATVMDDFIRINPGKALATKKAYSGPVEITLVARANEDISLGASQTARIGLSFETGYMFNKKVSLNSNTWSTFRWKLTEDQIEVAVDNEVVFSGRRKCNLSKAYPIRVNGRETSKAIIDVKSLAVVSLGSQQSGEKVAKEPAAKKEVAEKADRERREALAKVEQEKATHNEQSGSPKELLRLPIRPDTPGQVAISPDGKLLASGGIGEDHNIYLHELPTGKTLHSLVGHNDTIRCVVFLPDSKTLVSGSLDGTFREWDVKTGQVKRTVGEDVFLSGLGIVPDESKLPQVIIGKIVPRKAADLDGRLKIGDRLTAASGRDGKMVRASDLPLEEFISLLSGAAGTSVKLEVIPAEEKQPRTYEIERSPIMTLNRVLAMSLSPDGKTLAVGCTHRIAGTKTVPLIRIFEVLTGKETIAFQTKSEQLSGLAFSPDGKLLASAGHKVAKVWDVATGKELVELKGHKLVVCSVAFSPDGKILATVGTDKSVKMWTVPSWEQMQAPAEQTLVDTLAYAPVVFSPDGHFLAVGGLGNIVQIWDTRTGKRLAIRCLDADGGHYYALAFSPDSSLLASSSSWDRRVHLWGWERPNSLAGLILGSERQAAEVKRKSDEKARLEREDLAKKAAEEKAERDRQEAAAKKDAPTKAGKTPAPAKAPTEITAEFLPHKPGTTMYYDIQMSYSTGKDDVIRVKVTQKKGGVVEETHVRTGVLAAGKSILNGDKVDWLAIPDEGEPSRTNHRIGNVYVEVGAWGENRAWVPCLKLGAKKGDTWRDASCEYKVKGFTIHRGEPAVVIEEQRVGITTTRKYVAGVGEVEMVHLRDGKPFNIRKLVEEPKDQKEAIAKEEPAKKADETPAAAKVVPTEITADFSPHKPGTVQHYDAQMTLPDGKAAVIRRRVTQKNDGVIDSTTVRIGSLNAGESILKGDKVTWLKDLNQPSPSPTYHRIKGDFIENGSSIEGMDGVQWEPVLKIGAKDGDTWQWDTKSGTVEYKATLGLSHAGTPEVVIHTSRTKPLPMTQTLRYVKGIGEVERVSLITFKDNNKQTGIIKLVQEDGKQQQGNAEPGKVDANVVVIETTLGQIKVELFRDKAPITVKNFLQYVDDKFYDGTIIHRVIPNFMIQGGGLVPGLLEKKGRESIKNESSNALSNKRGTIAMARTIVADSATSQFFINVKDNPILDQAQSGDKIGYCVFGQVIEGMEVVDAIRQVATGNQRGHADVPNVDVVIKSIRRHPPSGSSIEPSSTGHGSVKLKEQSGLGNQGVFKVDGKLTKDDPKDRIRKASVHKVHTVKLLAGKRYTIDLVSRDFDAYLRLENSAGDHLAEDDDSGGDLNARIVFRASKDDTYRIIATSFDGKTGNYTLTIREGGVKPTDKGANVPAKRPEAIPGARKLDARVKTTSKENQDQNFTQHLQNLTVSATDKQIILEFDVDQKNWQPVTRSFSLIVRVFDKDGKYLSHFVTKESFTASPDVYDGWMMVVDRLKDAPAQVQAELLGDFTPKLLQTNGNRFVYGVNPAILRNGAIVEVGFIHVKKKVPF